MAKLMGYRLRDMQGCFYDSDLKVFITKDQLVDLSGKKVVPGTLTFQWIQEGGLVPVYEGESIPSPPVPKKVSKRKK